MLALFLTLFHSEKLSLRSRAHPPAFPRALVCAGEGERIHARRELSRVFVRVLERVCMCERRKNNGTELASNR